MLDRELIYRMPFERLTKLARTAGRRAFARNYYGVWALLVAYFALLGCLVIFADEIGRIERDYGVPALIWFVFVVLFGLVGFLLLRRASRASLRARVDYDASVRMRQEPDGLRFSTPQIEYLLKWQGIGQMFLEPDGVVVSHGALFFLVPNAAFRDLGERDAFVRDVFDRLSEPARERSALLLHPLIDSATNSSGNKLGTS